MIAAWRRGGVFDNLVVPVFMVVGAFPAFFLALIGLYVFGLKLGWFPIQHAYASDITPGFSWAFVSSAPSGTQQLPDPRDSLRPTPATGCSTCAP